MQKYIDLNRNYIRNEKEKCLFEKHLNYLFSYAHTKFMWQYNLLPYLGLIHQAI